jgi:hypothetical protein
VGKVSSILMYSFENSVESFFEPLLDIIYQLLSNIHRGGKEPSEDDAQSLRPILHPGLIDIIVRLLHQCDLAAVMERCGKILYLMVQLFPLQTRETVLVPPHDAIITAILTEERGGPQTVLSLLKMLKCLANSGYARVKKPDSLLSTLKNLCANKEPTIAKLASEVSRMRIG